MTFIILISYLLGSIPFGFLLARWMGEGDLREIGSGNIGATNALRTGNKKLAVLTLILDMLKGTAAVLIAAHYAPNAATFAGLIAVLGHIFPVWLKYKGGKGVATGFGVILGLSPIVFLLMAATWLAVFKWKRISSLAAICAFTLSPVYSAMLGEIQLALMCFLLAPIIFVTHRQNIHRLIKGEEKPFSNKVE